MGTASRTGTSLWKGLVAGALGGLIGSFAMNQFQASIAAASRSLSDEGGESGSQSSEGSDNATVRAARAISEGVLNEPLDEREKQSAGSAVHYAFGTAVGAVYGGAASLLPPITAGRGMLYGTAVFVLADEIGVPAAGLSAPPDETPASSHAQAFASHCVYGFVTDLVRRALLKMG
jgi:putative membrane protein